MIGLTFNDIREAFEFVNFSSEGEHAALLERSTGRIYLHSESGDCEEVPEALWDSDDVIAIPHKNDLDLGWPLVQEFVSNTIPELYEEVAENFRSPGAYGRCKRLLDARGVLQAWYDYEARAQEAALREWCRENGVALSE